jgi:2-hydroxymuconate-semialdehyde hydrolase
MHEASNPEVGDSIVANGINTNYHSMGSGDPVLLVHGSGPGVTAWANWRLVLPELSNTRWVIAPDMPGFGYTDRPESNTYSLDQWVAHLLAFIDALELETIDIVGNSFGGALALAFTIRHPTRVKKMVLMGAAGVSFPITEGLDRVWGYTPSFETMRELMDLFAYDRNLVSDELAHLRYQASIRPGFQESFEAMFPAPRQRWVDALSSTEADIKKIKQPALVIHGREDEVIPLQSSLTLANWIDDAQLHVFGRCGHWTQIEHTDRFCKLLENFFDETA